MDSIDKLISDLGKPVTIECIGPKAYQAICGNVMQYGETAQGAAWNVLRVTREGSSSPLAPPAPVETRRFMQNGIEIGEIPTAGQDSY